LLVIGVLLAATAVGFDVWRRAANMQPATIGAEAVMQAPEGQRLEVVVRLNASIHQGTYAAEVLESKDGANYRATPATIQIATAADTLVVMGAAGDIKPGAIVQADGQFDSARILHARRIVVLSGFVHSAADR